jgi:hypothetical protein
MTPDDIATLLRIKRAREQRAEVALQQAQTARTRAVKAREAAEQAADVFRRQRPAQETAIYRLLTAGPLPGSRLRLAAAQLSGIAAHGQMLRQQVLQAARDETTRGQTSATAQSEHATAMRASLGAAMMHQRLDSAQREADEQHQDADLEEVAGRCRAAWPFRS